MILPDTSAWIEYLRASSHPADVALNDLVERGAEVATTDVVMMELLAGARSDRHAAELRQHLVAFPLLRIQGLDDFERAAEIYRACRVAGETVRDLDDCLVASVAIRADAEVLHNDRDFDAIARHTPLQIYAAS